MDSYPFENSGFMPNKSSLLNTSKHKLNKNRYDPRHSSVVIQHKNDSIRVVATTIESAKANLSLNNENVDLVDVDTKPNHHGSVNKSESKVCYIQHVYDCV